MLEPFWKWTRLTSGPIIATGAAALVTLMATTILLRTLPIQEAGLFAISMALVETLSLVGGLGQATLITRIYAGVPEGAHDWLRDLARLMLLSIAPIGLGAVLAHLFYPLSSSGLALILLASVLSVPVSLSGYMLNAKLHHLWGSLLLRLPNSLLIAPAMLALWDPKFNNLIAVLTLYLVGIAISLVIGLFALASHLDRGERRISMWEHLEGMIFLIPACSYLLLDQGIVAIAGALLNPGDLAAFAAIAILLRPFKLVTNILSMIFSPQFMRNDRRSYAKPLVVLSFLAVTASAGYILVGPVLADAIYGTRYAFAYPLIPWLAIVGLLQVIRTIPTSHMAGRAPQSFIQRVVAIEAAVVALLTILTVAAILRWGILGLAIGLALAHMGRTAASFSLWLRFRQVDPAKGQPVSR